MGLLTALLVDPPKAARVGLQRSNKLCFLFISLPNKVSDMLSQHEKLENK